MLRHLTNTSIHEEAAIATFGAAAPFTGAPIYKEPLRLIVFSNRSGSNLLADYLHSTGRLIRFREAFNADKVKAFGCSDIVNHLRTFEEPGLGIGFKVNFEQFAMLLRYDVPRMFSGGIKAVWVYRNDLLHQAVSMSIAQQTGVWSTRQEVNGPTVKATFNFDEISECLDYLTLERTATFALMEIVNLRPEQVSYEDILEDPAAATRRAAAALGISYLAADWRPFSALRKQGDELNRTFVHRFREMALSRITRAVGSTIPAI